MGSGDSEPILRACIDTANTILHSFASLIGEKAPKFNIRSPDDFKTVADHCKAARHSQDTAGNQSSQREVQINPGRERITRRVVYNRQYTQTQEEL